MRNPAEIDGEHPQRRQSGRALTVVLAFVALGSVSALAYGVTQTFAPAAESAGVPTAQATSNRTSQSKTATASETGARRGDRSSSGRRTEAATIDKGVNVQKAAASAAGESNVMASLRKRREADAAARGDWKRSSRVVNGSSANRNTARFAPQSARSDSASDSPPASEAEADEAPLTPYTPGYAEVVGVTPNTPAHRAGIRNGARVLEYNGQPVIGSVALSELSMAPNLPESVPIVYQDRHGNTHETNIRSGDLKATLGQPYE